MRPQRSSSSSCRSNLLLLVLVALIAGLLCTLPHVINGQTTGEDIFASSSEETTTTESTSPAPDIISTTISVTNKTENDESHTSAEHEDKEDTEVTKEPLTTKEEEEEEEDTDGESSRTGKQIQNNKNSTAETTTKQPEEEEEEASSSSEDKDAAATKKPDESGTDTTTEEEDDPWGDGDESAGEANIVDQMRELREKDEHVPITRNVSHLNETFTRVQQAWSIIDKYYLPRKETWEKLLGLVTGLDVDVSPECFSSYFSGVSGFRGYQPWAYRFLDVRGRFPESGSMSGRLSSFGEWDECMELDSPQSSSTGLIVKGQYCMLEIKVPYPKESPDGSTKDLALVADEHHELYKFIRKYLRTFRLQKLNTPAKMVEALRLANGTIFRAGLCIPQLCKPHEVESVIMNLTYPIFKMPLQLSQKCYKKDQRMSFETHQIVAISLLTLLTAFVIFCTVVEWYNDSFDKRTAKDNRKLGALMFQRDVAYKPNPYLYSFSAITNTRALLKKQNHFAALDTIKFALVLYIHLYHYYNYLATVGLVTLKRIFTTYPVTGFRDDRYTWFRLTLPFDAIFIISGMIIAFSMQRKLKNAASKFNYLAYAFKLWIKFAFTYAGSILFLWVLPTLTSGPIWEYGMSMLGGCLNWRSVLTGFLFVSNYNVQLEVEGKSSSVMPYCNPPTWFMSALLQLLLLAPPIVYIGYKLSKRAKNLYFATLLIASTVLTIAPYLAKGIMPEVHFLEFETLHETFTSYAWYRLGTNTYLMCFVLGIIGGYMLADFKVLLRQEIENVILVVSFVLVQIAIALNNSFWRLDQSPKLTNSLLWYSCVRLLGALGLTYIFYTIASNRANTVQRFLEWHPFQAISRLSYSYFMVHVLVVFYRIFSVREVYAMTNSLMLQNFVIDFMITMIVAYLFYCIVECPIVNLLNLFQGKIFYDIEQYRPSKNGGGPNGNNNNNNTQTSTELRGQPDINGNGHLSKGGSSSDPNEVVVTTDAGGNTLTSYPPNIVIQEFNSANTNTNDGSGRHQGAASSSTSSPKPTSSSSRGEFEMKNAPTASSSSNSSNSSNSHHNQIKVDFHPESSDQDHIGDNGSTTIATSRL